MFRGVSGAYQPGRAGLLRPARWAADKANKRLGLRNITHGEPEIEGMIHFGLFDPDTGVVTFWKETISIPDLLVELQRIWITLKGRPPELSPPEIERPTFGRFQ